MASMTSRNVASAVTAAQLMTETSEVVNRADAAMSDLSRSMDNISAASNETSKIIQTIDDIAFQTNLLALNAAVEAARAGEAGAGFAVVADEVRNLAVRAAEAARSTVRLIEETVDTVSDGAALLQTTGDAFSTVVDGTSRIRDFITEIGTASEDQSRGIVRVKSGADDINKVTQQNAASADESAGASEALSAQAEQMKRMVQDLSSLIEGSAALRKPDARPYSNWSPDENVSKSGNRGVAA
jgi:methyl-accepting chemotaxis protein